MDENRQRKLEKVIFSQTRKSSCVNARGIPTAAYQVLHLLSYPGEGGGGTPSLALPHHDLGPVTGVYPSDRTWDQWKYYGMEMGYPQKGHGTSSSIMEWRWRWGTPPPPTGCEQTENITSRRTTYAVGNNHDRKSQWWSICSYFTCDKIDPYFRGE